MASRSPCGYQEMPVRKSSASRGVFLWCECLAVLHRDVFVRLMNFKLKDTKMILSELCGGMQPEDCCLVISVKSTHSSSTMACFFFIFLF